MEHTDADRYPSPTRAGRPRRADVESAVRHATAELITARGYAGTTLDQIARAAHVAKTTVYRRWPSKGELALDVLVEALGTPPAPSGGVETGLREAIGWLAAQMGRPEIHQLLTGLVAEAARDAEVRRGLRERIRAPFAARMEAVWRVSPERTDLAFDVVVGSLLHHVALAGAVEAPMVEAITEVAVGLVRPDAPR